MFSGFGALPKEKTQGWVDIVAKPNTEKNRQDVKHQSKGNNNDEDVESRAPAHNNNASHSRVDDEVRSRSPVVPIDTATHGDDTDGEISSTPHSIFSTSPDEVKVQPPVVQKSSSIKSSNPERLFNWQPSPMRNHTTPTTTNTPLPTTNHTTTTTTTMTTNEVEYEDIDALKAAAAKEDKEKAAKEDAPSSSKPEKVGFGFGIEWDPSSATSSDYGFGGSTMSSESSSSTVPTTVAAGVAKSEEQPKTVPHFTSTKSSGSGGFGGFGGFGNKSATVTAPAATPSFGVFAPRPATNQSTTSGFGGLGNKSATVTAPTATPSFGATDNKSATTATSAATPSFGTFAPRPVLQQPSTNQSSSSGFGGFGNKSATVTAPSATPSFGGFGARRELPTLQLGSQGSRDTSSTVTPSSGFSGFGTKSTEAPSIERPTIPSKESAFSGFGTFTKTASSPIEKPPVASSGFGTFKSTVAPSTEKTAVPQKESTFAGFGTFKNAVSSPTVPSSGFGTFNKTVSSPTVPSSGFGTFKNTVSSPTVASSGFGTFKNTVSSPTVASSGFGTFKNAEAEKPVVSPSEKIQMSFGKLNVSGPARVLNALKETEQKEERQKAAAEEEAAKKEKKRVHFEDVDELKKALHTQEMVEKAEEEAKRQAAAPAPVVVKEEPVEIKQEPALVVVKEEPPEEETETDDETEPTHRAMPWGKRPCFRAMLDGGNKKLVLESPPSGVSNYFMDQVYRSYGCTYDSESSTFYATSPGGRGQSNGQVVAMAGNCMTTPVCVTRELLEPAAIAVYEPGLSVCVVTNRGIFVFTRQYDQQGVETGKYLSRQISFKGFHRGIAATAHGGIVSFSNGRIRMFDGTVSNGEERVLAEANYDQIINNALFADNPPRRAEKSNCCFMDIVENRLVMSDLQKHVISLWCIDESLSTPASRTASITFVRAVDVAISVNQTGKGGKISSARIPPGKCCYASGIRLDAEGWVLCADADGRTIQIYDDQLNFMTRVDPPSPEGLPYISGLYIEAGGHLMVCDRKSEMGGLRVYVLESVEKTGGAEVKREVEDRKPSFGFAAASKMNHQSGRRF